ncbi:MAG: DUF3052 domain-containing protein [Bacteroidia bacterium]|nr:DUF3052 domain-containing protein [Bacteroidia bacterium]
MAGYSSTPLAKKLGLKAGFRSAFHQIPNHYFELFSDLPDDLTKEEFGMGEDLNFIHVFCTSMEEVKEIALTAKGSLKKDGTLWVSWPKGKSKIATDLKRDWIREYFLEAGLVDVKVAAIDEDWSGLKFVYRVKDR